MRQAFSECLLHTANRNKKFLVLTGDHGYGIFDKYKKNIKNNLSTQV